MADYVQTASDVRTVTANANLFHKATAGETITAGSPCYIDASDNNEAKNALADNAITANVRGIAASSASAGQEILLQYSGTMDMGFSSSGVGDFVVLSAANAGKCAPESDLTTGDYITQLGIVITTQHVMQLIIFPTTTIIP